MNGLDIILLLKSGAKLQLFFELCKCLSDNFLNYFSCDISFFNLSKKHANAAPLAVL